MSDKAWTPVKIEWDKDVGIVGDLNKALRAMNSATDMKALMAAYGQQWENTRYLLPEGREKWERAYAMNVLRLTKPDALRPDNIYVAVTAEAKGKGVYDYAEVGVYSSMADAVRSTIASLAKFGDLHERMSPDDLTELVRITDAAEPDWMLAYDHLRQKLRGVLVTIMPQQIDYLLDDLPKIEPERGRVAALWPSPRIKLSSIEHRYANGGKVKRTITAFDTVWPDAKLEETVEFEHTVSDSPSAFDELV